MAQTGGVNKDIVASVGTLQYRQYTNKGEIQYTTEGDFDLAAGDDGYRLKILFATEYVERGILLASNFKEIYQAQKLRKLGSTEELGGPFQVTSATFERRVMPYGELGSGAGPVQALVLAYLLCANVPGVVSGSELTPEFCPENMLSRARRVGGASVRTEVLRDKSNAAEAVRFWTFRPGTTQTTLERSNDCFLLGELRIEEKSAGLPVSVFFVANAMHVRPEPGQPQLGSPILDVRFTAEVRPLAKKGLFNEIAYDPVAEAHVSDFRFPGGAKVRYTLKKGMSIPFFGSGGVVPNIAEKTHSELVQQSSDTKNKRRIVFAVAAVLAFGTAGVIVLRFTSRRRAIDQQKKTGTKSDENTTSA